MTADISGIKFADLNRNGIWEPELGERPLPGFTIYLDEEPFNGELDSDEESVVTGPNGEYIFRDVPPGTYELNEVPIAGFPPTNLPQLIVVPEDVGNFPESTIEIEKFLDINENDELNENGFRDEGEPGVAGITVFLDLNENGIRDRNEPFEITNANGAATFNNLPAGTYHVREQLEAKYKPTTPDIFIVDLEAGDSETVVFGNAYKEGMIMGWKFQDNNENGIRDRGEPGLQGWTIELYEDTNNDGMFNGPAADMLLGTQTTVAGGFYMFPDVQIDGEEKTFFIREVQQPGFAQTNANVTDLQIILPAAGSRTVNFGNVPVGGSISGRKFEDENRNGVPNGQEPGLAGWTIFLDADRDGILDNGEMSVVTDRNGDYTFTNLPPGTTYNVREVQQEDYIQTTSNPPPIDLAPGQNVTEVNFGNDDGSITGIKFRDDNGDGIRNAGEPVIADWEIQLIDSDGNISTTRTGSNGRYLFDDLGRGDYTVREEQRDGFRQTAPGGNGTFNITLAGGEDRTDVNFGNAPIGSISGEKYLDVDRDGQKDTGEPGLEGWTIFLDDNNNGELDNNESFAVTDSDGNYSFDDLLLGDYIVREVQQEGFEQTEPAPQEFARVNLTINNPNATDVDFGNAEVLLGSISGKKFRDDNRDGVQNGEEPGLDDWTIQLINASGAVIATTTTNANGDYSFTDIEPGDYTVREVPQGSFQDRFTPTTPNPVPITLDAGEDERNVDFGNFIGGSISGVKFRDRDLPDPDGMRDPADEELLPGFTIYLDRDDDGELDENEEMSVTGDDGSYTFTDLEPGTYNIREVQREGVEQTTTVVVELDAGEDLTDIKIGNRRDGQIIGEIFEDKDGDGEKDIGERGIVGIRVYLNRKEPRVSEIDENTNLPLQLEDVSSDTGGYNFPNLDAPLGLSDNEEPEIYEISVLRQDDRGSQNRLFTAEVPGEDGTTKYYLTSGFIKDPELPFPGSGDPYLNGDDENDFGFIRVVSINDVNGVVNVNLDDAIAIEDFEDGQTLLELPDDVTFNDLDIQQGIGGNSGNIEIKLRSDDPSEDNRFIAVLLGVDARDIDENDFIETSGSNRGSISGVAFLDNNDNGVRNAGDPGVPGLTFYLDENDNGVLNSGEDSVITSSTGGYNFPNLVPGNYIVRQVPVDGFALTNLRQEVTIDAQGQAIGNINFANTVPNPNQQTGTAGRNDFSLSLNQTTVIQGFAMGQDFLVLPSGLDFSDLIITGEGDRAEIRLADTNRLIGVLLGVEPGDLDIFDFIETSGSDRGSISGVSFLDNNSNGVQDLRDNPGVGLTLYLDRNDDGVLDSGEDSVLTNITGSYSFTNLLPGNYIVRQVPVDGFALTNPRREVTITAQGQDIENINFANAVSNPNQQTGTPGRNDFSLSLSQTAVIEGFVIGQDFLRLPSSLDFSDLIITGEGDRTEIRLADSNQLIGILLGVEPGDLNIFDFIETSGSNRGSISGVTFLDNNGNGIQDEGDSPGVALTLYLDANDDGVLNPGEDSVLTNSTGGYSFPNLDPGNYIVRQVPVDGFALTNPRQEVTIDAQGQNLGNTNFANAVSNFNQQTGTPDIRDEFSLILSQTVAGFVFQDNNGDGIRTAGEPRLKNFPVYLDINNNLIFDIGEPGDETNDRGLYAISNVPDGNFTVRGVDNFVQTTLNTQVNVMGGFTRLDIGYSVNQLRGTMGIIDTFSLSASETVVINGFEPGIDRLQLNNGLNFSDLIITAGTGDSGNTSISYNNPVTNSDQAIAELIGVQPEAIDRQDFIIS